MDILGAAHGWGTKGLGGGRVPTYPTIMKLGSYTLPKEDPKSI